MDIVLSLVFAFLVCGGLSALFQVFMMLTKLQPPVILIIGFTVGALCVPLGALAVLEGIGGAGMSITVMAAGGAACGTIIELLSGNFVPFATVMSVFASLAVIGIIAGVIRNKTVSPLDVDGDL